MLHDRAFTTKNNQQESYLSIINNTACPSDLAVTSRLTINKHAIAAKYKKSCETHFQPDTCEDNFLYLQEISMEELFQPNAWPWH